MAFPLLIASFNASRLITGFCTSVLMALFTAEVCASICACVDFLLS